ncbi:MULTISPECIES: hypothetical protein [Candidatus Microthrix]|jgi:L-lactate utilization protein LutC|uniref:Uncharacterized protein n=1 Tax=Candidatus Neomicrothrix parvicella RN1 TaxID=1229780 RepID=R4YZH0_9ACTN|nr:MULTISPECIES: hypothetical protein [Microthrix]MBK7020862.1 hypothetical protein [Candidatus Microthrix sp.]CCM62436.1 hypothetical protein BN381_120005 [Candidatus Microthrix parvicella RN1]
MKTSKHPKNLTEDEAAAIVKAFDDAPDDGYVVVEGDALAELRAAAAERQDAVDRINSAAMRARSEGASWGVIGAQLGMTRQGARQRFERLTST